MMNSDYMRELRHHGIKGQKWGVMNGPPYPIKSFNSPKDLLDHMRSFKYKEFDKLMSPDEVERTKSGSCHDQVIYEMRELRRMGKDPKGLFMVEYNDDQGGTTHSLVFYKDGKDYIWIENAWGGREGLHKFNSVDGIKRKILEAHKNNEFGDNVKYKNILFSEFSDSDHKIGENLQEFVANCFPD